MFRGHARVRLQLMFLELIEDGVQFGQGEDAWEIHAVVGFDAVNEDAMETCKLGATHVSGIGVSDEKRFGGRNAGSVECKAEDFRMGFFNG